MDLIEVAKKRSVPGVLILDHQKKAVFFNPVALRILSKSNGAKHPPSKRAVDITLPVEISNLHENLKNSFHPSLNEPVSQMPSQSTLFFDQNETFCCRGFFINYQKAPSKESFHIMILIEKISQYRKVNLEKIKENFYLTNRQVEILDRLARGASNKEIADNLCVSEDTVKGHLKHIMNQLRVHSRTGILSMVFQL